MIKKLLMIAVALGVIGAAAGGTLYYLYPVQVSIFAGLTRNYLLTWFAPRGTTTTESNAAYKDAGAVARALPAEASSPNVTAGDWPSYNRTLTSERYSPLNQINTKNVGKLKVLCTYDVGQFAAFESGLIMVDNALIGTTEFDIFSLNPATCAENWRTHEDYPPSLLPANRGAAYMDGMLFRGTQDGRVLAYEFKTGKRMWERQSRTRSLASRCRRPRLPGTASSSSAMRAETTRVARGTCTRSRRRPARSSGSSFWFPKPRATRPADRWARRRPTCRRGKTRPAYRSAAAGPGRHTRSIRRPGSSTSPAAIRLPTSDRRARGREPLYRLGRRARRQDRRLQIPFQACAEGLARLGRLQPARADSNDGRQAVMSVAPKDGHLYGFDLANNSLLYRVPVTQVEDVAATFSPGEAVHFCPGSVGGAEWNSPAYDPQTNLYPRRRGRLVRHGNTKGCR